MVLTVPVLINITCPHSPHKSSPPIPPTTPAICAISFSLVIFSFSFYLSFSFSTSSSCLVTAYHLLLSSWSRDVLVVKGSCRRSSIVCIKSFHKVFMIKEGFWNWRFSLSLRSTLDRFVWNGGTTLSHNVSHNSRKMDVSYVWSTSMSHYPFVSRPFYSTLFLYQYSGQTHALT